MTTISEEINALVEGLSPHEQQRILEFAQELAELHQLIASLPKTPLPPGMPGSALLRFKLPLEDVEAMERALKGQED